MTGYLPVARVFLRDMVKNRSELKQNIPLQLEFLSAYTFLLRLSDNTNLYR